MLRQEACSYVDHVLTWPPNAQQDGQQLGRGERARPITLQALARALAFWHVCDHWLVFDVVAHGSLALPLCVPAVSRAIIT
jgi:hypothetical protein